MQHSVRTSFLSQFCRTSLSSSRQNSSFSPLKTLLFIRSQSTQSQQQPFRDQTYPFPLYYHLLPPTTPTTTAASTTSRYALSFLPAFPKSNNHVIGFLDHDSKQPLAVKPNKFIENEPFNSLIHDVIKQNLDKDPLVQSVLQLQLEGWTHITDYRNPAPYGRIPLPEDIFGSVQIVDGVIQSSTYQRMPTHRIVSSNGLFQLSDYLHEKLLEYLKKSS